MEEIKLKKLTVDEAEALFPGSITTDILDMQQMNEDDYHTLYVLDGRLLSCCYEIHFNTWAVWFGGDWLNLEDVDYALFERLEDEGFTEE